MDLIYFNLFRQLLQGPEIEAKMHVVALLTCLLIGPVEVGNGLVGRPGILQMILVMANSEDYLQQVRLRSVCLVDAESFAVICMELSFNANLFLWTF